LSNSLVTNSKQKEKQTRKSESDKPGEELQPDITEPDETVKNGRSSRVMFWETRSKMKTRNVFFWFLVRVSEHLVYGPRFV